jgi:hypothetical protein
VRRPHYWHPRYVARPSPTVWRTIGYPYYVGGSDYVVVTPPAETGNETYEVVPVPVPAEAPTDSTDPRSAGAEGGTEENTTEGRYLEMQELADLIHEWRTMNESPLVHERIASGDELDENLLNRISRENQQFDLQTRAAMDDLARGSSAEPRLVAARQHLENLAELFESLPESRNPDDVSNANE